MGLSGPEFTKDLEENCADGQAEILLGPANNIPPRLHCLSLDRFPHVLGGEEEEEEEKLGGGRCSSSVQSLGQYISVQINICNNVLVQVHVNIIDFY